MGLYTQHTEENGGFAVGRQSDGPGFLHTSCLTELHPQRPPSSPLSPHDDDNDNGPIFNNIIEEMTGGAHQLTPSCRRACL